MKLESFMWGCVQCIGWLLFLVIAHKFVKVIVIPPLRILWKDVKIFFYFVNGVLFYPKRELKKFANKYFPNTIIVLDEKTPRDSRSRVIVKKKKSRFHVEDQEVDSSVCRLIVCPFQTDHEEECYRGDACPYYHHRADCFRYITRGDCKPDGCGLHENHRRVFAQEVTRNVIVEGEGDSKDISDIKEIISIHEALYFIQCGYIKDLKTAVRLHGDLKSTRPPIVVKVNQ